LPSSYLYPYLRLTQAHAGTGTLFSGKVGASASV
jgi:hypothetical protein